MTDSVAFAKLKAAVDKNTSMLEDIQITLVGDTKEDRPGIVERLRLLELRTDKDEKRLDSIEDRLDSAESAADTRRDVAQGEQNATKRDLRILIGLVLLLLGSDVAPQVWRLFGF